MCYFLIDIKQFKYFISTNCTNNYKAKQSPKGMKKELNLLGGVVIGIIRLFMK
jgi:hypothetical protein